MRRQQVYISTGTVLAILIAGGLALWWPPGAPTNSSNELGATLLGGSTVALAVLVAEFLVSTRMREIADHSLLAAQERERRQAELADELEVRREEVEEALERQRGKRTDRWAMQFMASFQQDLKGIDLSGRDLSGLYLKGCNLLRANLKGTNLNGANLSQAYLAWAYLNEATLEGTNLSDADLAGASLQGTDLSEANLAGANLTRANLIGASLAGARYDSRTVWPEGFEPQDCGAVRVRG
jgi:uncharacterized protein YjbI with pentapeptide repeats